MRDGPAHVLVVEANPGDVRLVQEAFGDVDTEATLHVVSDGSERLAFCRGRDGSADAPTPDVILLDLSLPQTDGRELPDRLHEDPDLPTIPVVVFISSDSRDEVREASRRGANAYLTKPVDPDTFIETVRTFTAFWLETARLPGVAE
jgi:CheY-like chemotaxis protein